MIRILAIAAAALAASSAVAQDASFLDRMPRRFGGDYRMTDAATGETSVSFFCLEIAELGVTPRDAAMAQLDAYDLSEGSMLFFGENVYDVGRGAETIEMAGALADDGALTIVEVHGTGNPPDAFITDGAWIGRLSPDMSRLRATWEPNVDGVHATLDLTPGCERLMAELR